IVFYCFLFNYRNRLKTKWIEDSDSLTY
ncbi:hypothetical protein TNIN_462191, partial [Trichonephila inaurata madagascariensis]